ncbi:translocation protein SEC62 [Eurytemora carolleeae]|uniref:translocation protein SEC62 n=1 Tax=Eurytemora carolleeae TaxID=1294199 RepID=UPI000C78E54B|nr:translocation protein SEC62 [Eurytemora carolleeae]|eukprot:XP_023333991.1 translocation protein SEC62-like [Eurytemora affinis]
MAERRKLSSRKQEKSAMNPKEPMTKIQKEITAWMKINIPTKKTKFLHSHVVEYFIGKKAVDLLFEDSPWAPNKELDTETDRFIFSSREHVVETLDLLLRYKMFHRARKILVVDEKKPKKKEKSDSKPEKEKSEETESERKESKCDTEAEEEKKKKRRIRLDMHLEQMFEDCTDAYVWLYDPIPWYYWIAGGAIVLVVIVLCLFPLWPRRLRKGTHWLAFIAACLMVVVLIIAILKYIIFGILYGLSGRKLKFWILPNLTEDVTFLESFWPLYSYKYTGEVRMDEDEVPDEKNENSDSNESEKAGFEFVEKSKNE